MAYRYAIYFAPPATSVFWRKASEWTGRDAAADKSVDIPAPIASVGENLAALTRSVRRYGFHATLKAPMRLAAGYDERDLRAALSNFAARTAPVAAGVLTPRILDGFLALVPVRQSREMSAFAAACVDEFEPFRASLSEAEAARRRSAPLTDRQAELLEVYGYPYVMDEFRMHMTLTDRLPATLHEAACRAARDWFADALAAPILIDRLALFVEPAAGAPFVRREDFQLDGQAGTTGGAKRFT